MQMPVIRDAEARDVPKLFKQWRALVAEEMDTYKDRARYPSLDVAAPEVAKDWFHRFGEALMDPEVRFWVAEVDGQIAGFLVAYHLRREVGYPKYYVHVVDMYVDPAFRRNYRVAAGLSAACEAWARELRVEIIECNCVATETQIKRWTRKGFTPYQVTLYKTAKWRQQDG